jgi:hypothetical protein
MEVKLAEALLRRKELQAKVDQLKTIKDKDLFETKAGRKAAHEGLDDFILQVPLLSQAEVFGAYDWHAKQLRLVDAAIQQANWTTVLEVPSGVMDDYKAPELKRK